MTEFTIRDREQFEEFLKTARLNMGLNQTELAERSGVPQNMISEIENGKRTPSFPTALHLIRGLDGEMTLQYDTQKDTPAVQIGEETVEDSGPPSPGGMDP